MTQVSYTKGFKVTVNMSNVESRKYNSVSQSWFNVAIKFDEKRSKNLYCVNLL